jgi:hypothetical protein
MGTLFQYFISVAWFSIKFLFFTDFPRPIQFPDFFQFSLTSRNAEESTYKGNKNLFKSLFHLQNNHNNTLQRLVTMHLQCVNMQFFCSKSYILCGAHKSMPFSWPVQASGHKSCVNYVTISDKSASFELKTKTGMCSETVASLGTQCLGQHNLINGPSSNKLSECRVWQTIKWMKSSEGVTPFCPHLTTTAESL